MKSMLIVGALAVALAGCTVDDGPSDAVVVGDGVVNLDWTIGDLKDARDCTTQGAQSIDVVVTTLAGNVVGNFDGYCQSFAIGLELAPGTYYGDATLLDASGRARTTPVDLGRFDMLGDDELDIPIDFPLDSFY